MDLPQLNQWSPSDAAALKEFLRTSLGSKLMTQLLNYKPRTTVEHLKTVEQAGLLGAYSAGYELCILNIYGSCNVVEQVDFSAKTGDMTKD